MSYKALSTHFFSSFHLKVEARLQGAGADISEGGGSHRSDASSQRQLWADLYFVKQYHSHDIRERK